MPKWRLELGERERQSLLCLSGRIFSHLHPGEQGECDSVRLFIIIYEKLNEFRALGFGGRFVVLLS